MATPPTWDNVPVPWDIRAVVLSGLTLPVARLRVPLYLGKPPTISKIPPEDSWLDTGAPLSVIPYHVHQPGLPWQRIPGVTTTWSGQPCDLGRIDVWLPTDQPPHLHGPLSLPAEFARSDPPGDPVPVLLGLEFFLAHQAEFSLLLPPQSCVLRLP